ncbi:MAG: hypothetical protein HOE90_03285 [Bacteriovoracaceae bacterium]|jgi:hypothetical protein|nr:hypothetical protein [Bacteriovoracaceae bacterium]
MVSIIIHELAHTTGIIGDPAYFGGGKDVPRDIKKRGWESIADTYGYWAKHGFCLPKKGKCK